MRRNNDDISQLASLFHPVVQQANDTFNVSGWSQKDDMSLLFHDGDLMRKKKEVQLLKGSHAEG